jgi:hypothetical protein
MLGQQLIDKIGALLPPPLRATLFVRGFALAKVPFLFLAAPVVEEASEDRCVVRIPLNFLTKNHLRSMYLGVLTIGADVTGGLVALEAVHQAKAEMSVIFKDMKAEFLKRPTGAVRFICEDGAAIRTAVHRGLESGERQNMLVHVAARVGEEDVAQFDMTLSLKRR